MSLEIEIEPDASRPLGGYAKILLPSGTLQDPTTSVSLYDLFKERYLGVDGWQPTEAQFGPYPVETQGDQQVVIVGPEIVNALEEFAAVRLGIGSLVAESTWPDTILQAPTAPPIGRILRPDEETTTKGTGLTNTTRTAEGTGGTADHDPEIGKDDDGPGIDVKPERDAPEAVSDQEPEVEAGSAPGGSGAEARKEPRDRGEDEPTASKPPWLWIVLALVLIGGAAWAYFQFLPQETEPAAPTPAPVPAPAPATEPCGSETLLGLDGGFADRLAALRACGADASPDTALEVLETGIEAGDAEALLLFGHLYNPGVMVPGVEDETGLSFSPQIEVAIDYYLQARDAGSDAAVTALEAACSSLRISDPSSAEDLCE